MRSKAVQILDRRYYRLVILGRQIAKSNVVIKCCTNQYHEVYHIPDQCTLLIFIQFFPITC